MSWGERSCVNLYRPDKACHPEMHTCNVDCPTYANDGVHPPDSGPQAAPAQTTAFDLLAQQARPQPPKLVCKKFPRNKPCFCGSGLKFKKCCLKKYDRNGSLS